MFILFVLLIKLTATIRVCNWVWQALHHWCIRVMSVELVDHGLHFILITSVVKQVASMHHSQPVIWRPDSGANKPMKQATWDKQDLCKGITDPDILARGVTSLEAANKPD